ncbi:hypothetical protein TSAR_013838 [Trichomalopsis sarcophagae]|uniref:Uncharacterized protein n=1 Tax=Trichomalopsis sarcophagae TaxID=543379 RepID=A0A232ETC7_9HYME|nr:hypothetical protein TSAR_013838 [Trichomalopsis sarcophagae]
MSRVYTRRGFRITIRRRVEECNAVVSALQSRGSRFKPGVRHFFVALFTHNIFCEQRSCPKASESTEWNTRNGLSSVL